MKVQLPKEVRDQMDSEVGKILGLARQAYKKELDGSGKLPKTKSVPKPRANPRETDSGRRTGRVDSG